MQKLTRTTFFAIAMLHLTGIALASENLVLCTKPLLMPLLATWLMVATRHHGEYSFFRKALLGALVFSTLGDVLLMFEGQIFFLLGLLFFLLAHVFYIGAFTSISSYKAGFLNRQPAWALPFLAFPILLLLALWSGIPMGMKLPVAAYASVITAMALSVVNLKLKISASIFWPMLAGALLFLCSDSLIAISRFGQPFDGAHLAIMATYILGQYGLVWGAVKVLEAGKNQ